MSLATTTLFNLLPNIIQVLDTNAASGGAGSVQKACNSFTLSFNTLCDLIDNFYAKSYKLSNSNLFPYIVTAIGLNPGGNSQQQIIEALSFVYLLKYRGTQYGVYSLSKFQSTELANAGLIEYYKTKANETDNYSSTKTGSYTIKSARINAVNSSLQQMSFNQLLLFMQQLGFFPANVMPVPVVNLLYINDSLFLSSDSMYFSGNPTFNDIPESATDTFSLTITAGTPCT